MIARLPFPPAPALLPDRPQVLIPLPGRPRAVAMLPDLGVPPRWNHGRGPALSQGVVTGPLVIGPVGADLANVALHLCHYVRQCLIIRDPGFAGHGRDNLARGFV